jgi:hypothetical protein
MDHEIRKVSHMPSHQVDAFGYPIDPHLKELEFSLCTLAARWGSLFDKPEERLAVVEEYHLIFEKLYSVGWDSELDFECLLPTALMPTEYLRRNPLASPKDGAK